jgi:hypothetical protein
MNPKRLKGILEAQDQKQEPMLSEEMASEPAPETSEEDVTPETPTGEAALEEQPDASEEEGP